MNEREDSEGLEREEVTPDQEAAFEAGFSAEDHDADVDADMEAFDAEDRAAGEFDAEGTESTESGEEMEPSPVAPAAESQGGLHGRVQRDVEEFAQAFPGVFHRVRADPGAIPEAVWDGVRAGLSLSAAYARYAVDQSKQLQQHQRNVQRSTGSMKSAGGDVRKKDAFLSGFDE